VTFATKRDFTEALLRAWRRRLIGVWTGEGSRRRRPVHALGRTLKLVVLLLLVVLALVSTTFLDRPSQVFLLKAFLVGFLSVLPGWLYLQFIAVKGTGLYDEYVLNLYRLRIDDIANLPKPPPGSRYWRSWAAAVAPDLNPARNIYLKKFEAVYGRSAVPESRRRNDLDDDNPHADSTTRLFEHIHADAFSPVIMATALLCVGWIVVVEPELYRGLRPFGDLTLSGLPKMPEQALRYGFIGSYAFILQSLVRRYFQADLKTHAYVSAMARVILVAALITAVHPLWSTWSLPAQAELAFGFFLGFFPELGLRVIQQGLVGVLRKARPADEERFPLRQLDGVTIWVQARFLEEGIEDMQNLATTNLVDLMLNTRTPINRLLDWIDQAFLYLRVGNGNGRRSANGDGNGAGDAEEDGNRKLLRRYGIRTATDLLGAFDNAGSTDPRFPKRFLRLLNDGSDDAASVTEGLRRALEGETNLWHVRQWKQHTWLKTQQVQHELNESP
jgi:hypothetical protein